MNFKNGRKKNIQNKKWKERMTMTQKMKTENIYEMNKTEKNSKNIHRKKSGFSVHWKLLRRNAFSIQWNSTWNFRWKTRTGRWLLQYVLRTLGRKTQLTVMSAGTTTGSTDKISSFATCCTMEEKMRTAAAFSGCGWLLMMGTRIFAATGQGKRPCGEAGAVFRGFHHLHHRAWKGKKIR